MGRGRSIANCCARTSSSETSRWPGARSNASCETLVYRAFPGAGRFAPPFRIQADRRIRDLRDYGWILHTRADDASLLPEQTRLVATGAEVWDQRARRAASPNKGISSKARDEILARDDYMCIVCGITGGEEYPEDSTQTAVLTVVKREGSEAAGTFATLCKRCHSGGAARVDAAKAAIAIELLTVAERDEFTRWVVVGRRAVSASERAWSVYLRLPVEDRSALNAQLGLDG